MKKGLVIYYSFEGNTSFVSTKLSEFLNFDILELKPKKEIKSKGFMKYIWGGAQVIMKKEPEIEDYIFQSNLYDTIIFASPVWAGTFTPPIKTFLSKEKDNIKGKHLAFVACHDGGLGKTFENFESEMKNNHFIGELPIEGALKNKKESEELIKLWIKEIF